MYTCTRTCLPHTCFYNAWRSGNAELQSLHIFQFTEYSQLSFPKRFYQFTFSQAVSESPYYSTSFSTLRIANFLHSTNVAQEILHSSYLLLLWLKASHNYRQHGNDWRVPFYSYPCLFFLSMAQFYTLWFRNYNFIFFPLFL